MDEDVLISGPNPLPEIGRGIEEAAKILRTEAACEWTDAAAGEMRRAALERRRVRGPAVKIMGSFDYAQDASGQRDLSVKERARIEREIADG